MKLEKEKLKKEKQKSIFNQGHTHVSIRQTDKRNRLLLYRSH